MSGRKKTTSLLDQLVGENPAAKKELERRLKTARVQGASLAEQEKEELRVKLVLLEKQRADLEARYVRAMEELRLKKLAPVMGDGSVVVGELRIANSRLEHEKENLEIALKDLQKSYSKLVNDAQKQTRLAR